MWRDQIRQAGSSVQWKKISLIERGEKRQIKCTHSLALPLAKGVMVSGFCVGGQGDPVSRRPSQQSRRRPRILPTPQPAVFAFDGVGGVGSGVRTHPFAAVSGPHSARVRAPVTALFTAHTGRGRPRRPSRQMGPLLSEGSRRESGPLNPATNEHKGGEVKSEAWLTAHFLFVFFLLLLLLSLLLSALQSYARGRKKYETLKDPLWGHDRMQSPPHPPRPPPCPPPTRGQQTAG